MTRPTRNQRKGATAVEFAFVAPILFLILFGCIELGMAHMMYHTQESAAYEGARTAIIPGITAADAINSTNRILATAGINNATVTVTPNDLSAPTNSVTVTVSSRFSDNIPLPTFFVNDDPMVRSCTLQRERLE